MRRFVICSDHQVSKNVSCDPSVNGLFAGISRFYAFSNMNSWCDLHPGASVFFPGLTIRVDSAPILNFIGRGSGNVEAGTRLGMYATPIRVPQPFERIVCPYPYYHDPGYQFPCLFTLKLPGCPFGAILRPCSCSNRRFSRYAFSHETNLPRTHHAYTQPHLYSGGAPLDDRLS